MKRVTYLLYIASLFMMAGACVKKSDAPDISDHILNYEIPEVPVDADYTVGAFYYMFTNFNPNIKEVPAVGKYGIPNGVIQPGIMSKHIEFAGKGGIDYFLFQVRSANRDANNYRFDSTLVKTFLDANTANMKFAVAYNLNTGTYSINNNAPLENDAVKLEQFFQDFVRLAPFFGDANYMKVNGKTLVYIMNAQNMYSNDNAAIYATLRQRLSALGFEMYIVGMQERWSPPARYPFRFQNCVDAVYHQSFSSQNTDWDRWYLLPQAMDQNWKYSKKWFADNLGIDYVPNISPAHDWKILQPNNLNPVYPRTDNGALYRTLCNVAKLNASASTRLVLIDSWNKWDEDMQLEPAESYGELYLNITREEFKKPK